MCLPRTNSSTQLQLSRTNNIINNRKRPIKHRLMKAKMFASQPQALAQAQAQPSSAMKTNNNTVTNTAVRKSVQFNNNVIVVPFEKVTLQEEKNNIWYNIIEMTEIKKESREIASSYRKFGVDECTSQGIDYRGFENCTLLRQRQKVMSNRSVVYAYSQGFNATEIATMYQQTNKWSSEVAFFQAIHDYINAYEITTNNDNDNSSLSQSMSMSIPSMSIPSISSMIPPKPHPFAIESVMVMQRKKKRERALKLAALALQEEDQQESNNRSISPTSTSTTMNTTTEFDQQQEQERSVRQRVC
jgi:hypothetical protein